LRLLSYVYFITIKTLAYFAISMVLVNIGEGRQDATCMAQDVSLPHQLVGANSRNSERLFSSGNERTLAVMPSMGVNNVGYKLNPEDKFALIVDLMNDNMEDKVVYLTITYDVIQGHPENYDDMKPIWFDLAQCSTSEVRPPQQNGMCMADCGRTELKRSLGSWTKEYTWESNLEGEILGGAGVRITMSYHWKQAHQYDSICTTEVST
jgi:hypothetical protein